MSVVTAIRLIIPSAPPPELSVNARRRGNHWAQAEATTIVKQHTKAALANNPQPWQEWLDGPLHLAVRICWPCGKKGKLPDVDQLGSYVKGYIDALEGTLFVNDDQIQRVSYEQTRLDRATTDSLYPDGAVILDFSPAQGETSE